jgi:hypothetical protein
LDFLSTAQFDRIAARAGRLQKDNLRFMLAYEISIRDKWATGNSCTHYAIWDWWCAAKKTLAFCKIIVF